MLKKHKGNVSQAAIELGISRAALRSQLGQMKLDELRAADDKPIITGKSTLTRYTDLSGEIILEWVKTKPAIQDTLRAVRIATDEIINAIEPLPEISPYPGFKNTSLLTLYTLTDTHIGLYAWHEETGASWDLDIAEKTFSGAIDYLAAQSTASVGLLNLQGDFLHYSGTEAKTELHGHALDADSRQTKMIRVAVRIIRSAVTALLKKHDFLIVSIVEGNHDISGTAYLSTMLELLYSENPRITLMNDPRPYKAYQHGKCFLGFTHGHLAKKGKLPEVFADKFSEMFGRTIYRVIHCGHMHHEHFIEGNNFKIQQHATIAAPDAYAARGGWGSQRLMRSVTYHLDFGEVATQVVTPAMLGLI